MKVTIVGSGGFVGMNLTRLLRRTSIDVQGFSSGDQYSIDPRTGSLSDEFSIRTGTDAVIYLAQSPFYRQVPERFPHLICVNQLATIIVAELARRAKVKRLIYASSGNVYAPSFQPLSENSPLRKSD